MAKFRYIDVDENNADPFASQGAGETDFEKLLNDDKNMVSAKRYRTGESVTGTVISVTPDYVFLDLGGKNSGTLSVEDFLSSGLTPPQVGESVTAFVRSDTGSEIILNRTLRRHEVDEALLRNAYETGIPVEAKVEKTIKGGFEAMVGNRRCFVPMGHMDIVRFDDPEVYVGNTFRFHIAEMKGRNIVLSRRALLREEMEGKLSEVLKNLVPGQTREATITRLADFGAFASIDGVEGLIPLQELAWKRIKKVSDVVQIGEKVHVKILKVESSPKLRIQLSLKDAGEDPWVSAAVRLTPGTAVEGVVARMIDSGAFVTVPGEIDGFVPVSQLTWEKRVTHPREILSEGQRVKVYVLSIDCQARRLSLSVKGPMPESLLAKAGDSRRSQQTDEDKALAMEWENYRKSQEAKIFAASNPADSHIFAAAFQNARKKNYTK